MTNLGSLPALDCSGCSYGNDLGKFEAYVGERYSPGGVLVIGHSAYSKGNGSWIADFRKSQTGRYFEPLLENAGQSLDSIAVTNAYKCLLPDGRSAPNRSALSECSGRNLQKEVEILRPGKIISWGLPVSTLLSEGTAFPTETGEVFEYLGIPAFSMYHPAYQVTRDPKGEKILPSLRAFLEK